MRVRDISIQEIQRGYNWVVKNFDTDDWLDWEIERTERATKKDVIFHSALLVQGNQRVYPFLLSKYYEDGGEVGELAILVDGSWLHFDEMNVTSDEFEGPYIANISTLDIHEYQKGVLDNRKEHRNKFNHYLVQLNKVGGVVKFKERDALPLKIKKQNLDEQIKTLRECILQIHECQSDNKISKHNKLVLKAIAMGDYLMAIDENHIALKKMLLDKDINVIYWMAFQLYDLFPEECIVFIKEKARDKSINGLGANYWLKQHGYEPERL